MAEVAHFRMPFDFVDSHVAEVEQDSMADVAGCVEVILRTPRGWREERPEFGRANPTFASPPDLTQLQRAVAEWEPRAEVTTDERGSAFDAGLRRLRMEVGRKESANG